MVDVSAYWTLHSDSSDKLTPLYTPAGPIKVGAKAMESDEPPDGGFVYLLPPTIRGYNMVEKKWSKRLANCALRATS
jgi:hypothetical protein